MQTMENFTDGTGLGKLDAIADALVSDGYVLIGDALPQALAAALMHEAHTFKPDVFVDAGTGREQARQLNQRIRKDRILWLEGKTRCCREYLDLMESLRAGINQRFFYLLTILN